MTEPAATPALRPRRRWKRRTAVYVLLAALLLLWYLNSARFQAGVQARLTAELERVTGARVEIQRFDWSWLDFGFTMDGLTLHGLEPHGAPPLARVDHLEVRLQVLSYLTGDVWLRSVALRRPELHLTIGPDGRSNLPAPRARPSRDDGYLHLFEVTIDRVSLDQGVLVLNARNWPLQFAAEALHARLDYVPGLRRYDGVVSLGRSLAGIGRQPPLRASAEGRFQLYPTRADLTEFRLTTAGSRIQGHAAIEDLRQLRGTAQFNGSLSLEEIGRVVQESSLRAGVATVSANSTFAGSGFTTVGKVALRAGAWRSPHINLAGVDVTADFRATEGDLRLDDAVARALGGVARGRFSLAGWAEEKNSPRRIGQARFAVEGVSLTQALRVFSRPGLRLETLSTVGTAAGVVSLDWVGAHTDARIAFDGAIAPLAPGEDGGVPVTASARGSFDARLQVLRFDRLDLSTPSTRIRASGAWGAPRSELALDVTARRLAELEPAIALFGGPGHLPVTLAGDASFLGAVSGRLDSPEVRGRIHVNDFASRFWLAGDPPRQPRQIHWDSFEAALHASASRLSLQDARIRHDDAIITFRGELGLHHWRPGPDPPLRLDADLRDASVEEIRRLAGVSFPITGSLRLSTRVTGSVQDLHGSADLLLSDAALYGEPFRSIESAVRFDGGVIEFSRLTLRRRSDELRGRLRLDRAARTMELDLAGHDLDLAQVQRLQAPRLAIAGTAELKASARGPWESPGLDASLAVSSLAVNGEVTGDLAASARSQGGSVRVDAKLRRGDSTLAASGSIALTQDLPASLSFVLDGIDLDPLLDLYLAGRLTSHSSVSGSVTAQGPLLRPRDLTLAGSLQRVDVAVEGIALSADRPVTFRMDPQRFVLQDFHIQGEGTDLGVSGSVDRHGDRRLDLRAAGRANLKLFQGFNRDLLSAGDLAVGMTVSGTWERPALAGSIEIHNASVALADLPNGLSNIEGTLAFDQDRLEVRTLTARTGGGTLDLGGTITFRREIFLDLTATGRDIRLRYPPGVSSAANADLRYVGTLKSGLISGDAVITRIGISPRFDLATVLAGLKQAQTRTTIDPTLEGFRLDVHVVSAADLRFETALMRVAGDADLRIRGSLARPNVLGRVTMAEGDLSFGGTRYRLERGEVTFTNPVRIEPTLNLEAAARVRDYDITIAFRGPADKLTATYRSEPPLPTADIIALLAFGRTRQDSSITATTQSFNESTTNALLGEALDAAISSRVQKIFGVSRIKIDPSVGGVSNNPNARVTIEQQVADNVTLTYTTDVTRSAQQVIQAEFNLTRDVSLLMVRDQDGVFSVDVRFRRRKK
jgi:translocation and assembly module TamB